MIRCLSRSQIQTKEAVDSVARTLSDQATHSMTAMSTSYTTSLREVTQRLVGLTELWMVGRDSPTLNENSQTNSNEPATSPEPEIALSDLPESATWASEEEDLLQTTMPWQSSTPLQDSELPL
jgi:hypothetical protein